MATENFHGRTAEQTDAERRYLARLEGLDPETATWKQIRAIQESKNHDILCQQLGLDPETATWKQIRAIQESKNHDILCQQLGLDPDTTSAEELSKRVAENFHKGDVEGLE